MLTYGTQFRHRIKRHAINLLCEASFRLPQVVQQNASQQNVQSGRGGEPQGKDPLIRIR